MPRTARKTAAAKSDSITVGRFVLINAHVAHEPARKLMWTRKSFGRFTHAEAEKHIAQLNAEKHGGHDDWRLPTVEELFGLADRTKYDPAIDEEAFPGTECSYYRTSTKYAPNPDYRWGVDFSHGYSDDLYDDCGYFVRAFRASQ